VDFLYTFAAVSFSALLRWQRSSPRPSTILRMCVFIFSGARPAPFSCPSSFSLTALFPLPSFAFHFVHETASRLRRPRLRNPFNTRSGNQQRPALSLSVSAATRPDERIDMSHPCRCTPSVVATSASAFCSLYVLPMLHMSEPAYAELSEETRVERHESSIPQPGRRNAQATCSGSDVEGDRATRACRSAQK
jgi:hypothetical protein